MWWGIGRQLRKLVSGRAKQQVAAARLLGRSHDPRALQPLFEFLAQGEGTILVNDTAFEALSGYRDPHSLDFFFSNLGGADERRAGVAADVLAAIKCRDAIPPLLAALQEGKATRQVALALVKLEAFEPLANLLHSGRLSSAASRHLLLACKGSRNPACIELLLPLLRSPDFELRRMAAEAIEAVDGEAARQKLIRILPELDFEGLLLCVPAILKLTEDEGLRSSALRPYYQIFRAYFDPSYALDLECMEKLFAILQSDKESARGRAFAAERLGRNPDSRAIYALRQVMRSGVSGVWRAAARAFHGSPERTEDGLDRLLLALDFRELDKLDAAAKAAMPSLPAAVVENLIEEDPYGADRVIDGLQQNGWRPRTPGEAAVYHILRREWDRLAGTGEACIEPLVEVAETDSSAFDDETRRGAAHALEAVIGHLCAELPERILRLLAGLSDPVRIEEEVGAEIRIAIYSWRVMRSCIARELERRGLR